MKLEDRMRLSIRRRAGQVVLRSELAKLGSASQVSQVLKTLQSKGELIRVGFGIYAKAQRDSEIGVVRPIADTQMLAREVVNKLKLTVDSISVEAAGGGLVLNTGSRRISRKLNLGGQSVVFVNGRTRSCARSLDSDKHGLPTTGVGRFVRALARKYNVHYGRTAIDQWAETVTRLADDEIRSDPVEDLLVALKRAGKLSTDEMAALLVNYLRESRQGV